MFNKLAPSLYRTLPPKDFLRLLRVRSLLDRSGFPITPSTPDEYRATLDRMTPGSMDRGMRMRVFLEGSAAAADAETVRRDFEESIARSLKTDPNLWPPENPFVADLVHYVDRKVRRVVTAHGADLANTVIGELPTGEINALVFPVPSGGQVIGVDAGAIIFLGLFSLVVSSSIPVEKLQDGSLTISLTDETLDSALQASRGSTTDFRQLLRAYRTGTLTTESVPRWARDPFMRHLSPGQQFLSGTLVHTALMFVVAHEYSHILLGHTSINLRPRLLTPRTTVDSIYHRKDEEIAADTEALGLVLACYDERVEVFRTMVVAGIEFLLSALQITEDGEALRKSKTHPPARVRQENIRSRIRERFPLDNQLMDLGGFIDKLTSGMAKPD